MTHDPSNDGMKTLVSAQTTTRWVRILYAACVLLVLAGVAFQLFTHAFGHAHYGFERWPGFYGVFGFAAFVLIVYAGKLLRRLVKRDENYYRPDEPERSR